MANRICIFSSTGFVSGIGLQVLVWYAHVRMYGLIVAHDNYLVDAYVF